MRSSRPALLAGRGTKHLFERQLAPEDRALLILLKMAETSVPIAVRMMRETMAISAAIRHYSMRVTPSLSARNRLILLIVRTIRLPP